MPCKNQEWNTMREEGIMFSRRGRRRIGIFSATVLQARVAAVVNVHCMISSEGNADGKSTDELSETEDFADCMEKFPIGLDEEAIGEAMNSEQETAGASTNLIPGLPDDFVVVQIWPLIASSYATLRGVNRKWRQLVKTSPKWLAVEVVCKTERYNEFMYVVFRERLAERVEEESQAIITFLRELNRESMFRLSQS
ncbi:hypothetical protein R1sor_018045 [Riccia sorocarpa]|uniref:F-box domain-containing protein n=1 Tax=Riccia sorocarpa TaxID=122646 RepID=A0ABD3I8N2_9MARC